VHKLLILYYPPIYQHYANKLLKISKI